MPSGLIDQEDGVGIGRDDLGDLREVQVHRLAIAGRQDQSGTLAIFGTDGAEDVGGGGALITGSAWACAALCPPAGDLVLLADTSLVLEPDFYIVSADRIFARDCLQARGEVYGMARPSSTPETYCLRATDSEGIGNANRGSRD